MVLAEVIVLFTVVAVMVVILAVVVVVVETIVAVRVVVAVTAVVKAMVWDGAVIDTLVRALTIEVLINVANAIEIDLEVAVSV